MSYLPTFDAGNADDSEIIDGVADAISDGLMQMLRRFVTSHLQNGHLGGLLTCEWLSCVVDTAKWLEACKGEVSAKHVEAAAIKVRDRLNAELAKKSKP